MLSPIHPILSLAVSRYRLRNRPVLSHPNNNGSFVKNFLKFLIAKPAGNTRIAERSQLAEERRLFLPLLGERVGVGASVCDNCLSRPTGLALAALFGFRHSDFFRISAFGIRISALALLAGCAVGPNYKRPQATTIPGAYTGATNVVAT